jgi:cyclopropane fatty-acyl-phospholipid synthase-like methyltransferase
MGDSAYLDAVSAHYTTGDLGEKILATLRDAGKDLEDLHVEDLARIDQLHTGGAPATRALMQRATLRPGMDVLDADGGLGGPARLLAHEAGCSVTMLDLAGEFCTAGAMPSARAGLSRPARGSCSWI